MLFKTAIVFPSEYSNSELTHRQSRKDILLFWWLSTRRCKVSRKANVMSLNRGESRQPRRACTTRVCAHACDLGKRASKCQTKTVKKPGAAYIERPAFRRERIFRPGRGWRRVQREGSLGRAHERQQRRQRRRRRRRRWRQEGIKGTSNGIVRVQTNTWNAWLFLKLRGSLCLRAFIYFSLLLSRKNYQRATNVRSHDLRFNSGWSNR